MQADPSLLDDFLGSKPIIKILPSHVTAQFGLQFGSKNYRFTILIPEHVPEISEYKEKFNLLTNRIKILEDQLVQSSKNIKLVEDQLIQSSKNIQLVAIQRTDEIRDRIENLADCLNRSNKKIDNHVTNQETKIKQHTDDIASLYNKEYKNNKLTIDVKHKVKELYKGFIDNTINAHILLIETKYVRADNVTYAEFMTIHIGNKNDIAKMYIDCPNTDPASKGHSYGDDFLSFAITYVLRGYELVNVVCTNTNFYRDSSDIYVCVPSQNKYEYLVDQNNQRMCSDVNDIFIFHGVFGYISLRVCKYNKF